MDRATMLAEGKMDAYLIAEVGSKKLKTEIKTTIRDECTWNQTMNIPVKMPLMASKLIIKLYDDDPAGDEICGSLIFDYKTLLKMEKGSVFWVNVEGPPGGDE
jgi:Ca2+-dependent lipid-binding protein